jgi:hypothetical protein
MKNAKLEEPKRDAQVTLSAVPSIIALIFLKKVVLLLVFACTVANATFALAQIAPYAGVTASLMLQLKRPAPPVLVLKKQGPARNKH